MDQEMWMALAILFTAIVFFITEWIRMDMVAMGVVVALMLTDLLPATDAIAGFSNTAVIIIGALFIVGGAVFRTGLANQIGLQILKIAGTDETRLNIVIMVAVAILSGFMSNTGTVAVLMPAVVGLAASTKISPSKLLMPLAFASSLGGVMTLIGTPPNIVVSDAMADAGYGQFNFFEFTPIGIILLVAGVGFMVLLGKHLLPDHQPEQEMLYIQNPDELIDIYRISKNLFRLRLRQNSKLVGQTLGRSNLRNQYKVTVLEIIREATNGNGKLLSALLPERKEKTLVTLSPSPELLLKVNDILLVQGIGSDIAHAAAVLGFGIQPASAEDEQTLINQEVGVAEIVLSPRSSLIGKTIQDMRFGTLYKLNVLSIKRPGEEKTLDVATTTLDFGDILFVQGAWENILQLRKNARDFIVMGQPEAMIGAPHREKAPVALVILAAMIFLMVTNIFPLVTTAMLAAMAIVLTGCLTVDEAYDSIDWKSLFLIAGMIPMSTALQRTGFVNLLAGELVNNLESLGPLMIMGGLFLLTAFFTQVLSNTATAVLVAPIAIATAQQLEVRPEPFMMAIAVSASMAFGSPVASPVNTLVMAAGDYSFGDYMKVGVPLILVTMVVSLIFIPLIWSF